MGFFREYACPALRSDRAKVDIFSSKKTENFFVIHPIVRYVFLWMRTGKTNIVYRLKYEERRLFQVNDLLSRQRKSGSAALMIRRAIIFACIALSALGGRPALAQASPEVQYRTVSPEEEAAGIPYRFLPPEELDRARAAADKLLTQLEVASDSLSELDHLYGAGGQALQTRYTAQAYAARLIAVRRPLGVVRDRTFLGFNGPYRRLPNVISGDYLIILFSTRFREQLGTYTEQVTLEADRSGASGWKFVEYYVSSR